MQFIKSITFKKDVVLRTSREKHLKHLKVRSKTFTVDDRAKPKPMTSRSFGRHEYEKKKVTHKYLTLFTAGTSIEFRPITVIVGDNGSGKSTLLQYLKPPEFVKSLWLGKNKTDEEYHAEKVKKWLVNDETVTVFEQSPELIVIGNEIHKTQFIEAIGAGKTALSAQDIVARWSMSEDSNGETTMDFITSLSNLEGCLIVLDEPETSLSIKSQIKMRNLAKRLAEKNQIIVVTHSQYFMEMSKDVYDFEKKLWTSTTDYIKSQIQSR
jgi:predicted ATPase